MIRMGMGKLILTAAFLALAYGTPAYASEPDTPCARVNSVPGSVSGHALASGKYRLTLVASSGSKKGVSTTGRLILIPTTKNDVSPRNGARPAANDDLADNPLYGTTSVDFDAVNAPVDKLSGILDPVYPDVMVTVIDFEGIKRQPVALIGTVGNRRDGKIYTDGAGIGLFTQLINTRGFFGTWSEWGIVIGGSGYFCAIRVPNT